MRDIEYTAIFLSFFFTWRLCLLGGRVVRGGEVGCISELCHIDLDLCGWLVEIGEVCTFIDLYPNRFLHFCLFSFLSFCSDAYLSTVFFAAFVTRHEQKKCKSMHGQGRGLDYAFRNLRFTFFPNSFLPSFLPAPHTLI